MKQRTRRDFLASSGALTLGTLTLGSGFAQALPSDETEFDYIVVGSGAGGAPLAANLARAGFRVLVLEAGLDHLSKKQQIPALHSLSSEDPAISWNFYVKHYEDALQQRRDSKFVAAKGGVLYPRAATLGGCTAHHAMITVYPHNSDFDAIRDMTGDVSWDSERMRPYFQRLENAAYVDSIQDRLTDGRHGYEGWLGTSTADPRLALRDPDLLALLLTAASKSLKVKNLLVHLGELGLKGEGLHSLADLLSGPEFDPNHWQFAQQRREGFIFTPVSITAGRRRGPREYLLETQRLYPQNLEIRTGALAEQVLFRELRAVGVRYREGQHLYEADPLQDGGAFYRRRSVFARREVILCGGAFNTPQLLMLSGIGPEAELQRHGIPVLLNRPGVGRNLQDRYEAAVVSQLPRPLRATSDCSFTLQEADPCLANYELKQSGVYATNGVLASIIKRSAPEQLDPDLFIFAVPTSFKGYYPNYSLEGLSTKSTFTWLVLKAHTSNSAGTISLRSADPTESPEINFRYFEEGNGRSEDDIQAVVEGIKFVRGMMGQVRLPLAPRPKEIWPGPEVVEDESLRQFVRDEAWGHHASCTARIGHRDDPGAVVDSDFRVHGVTGLRVVDASVFPKIPGFFIVSAIYMISEKACDVIVRDARREA